MSKVKFYFNTKSLKYEKVQVKFRDRFKKFLSYVASGIVFASITIWFAYTYFDSPKEKQLKREIEEIKDYYYNLSEKMTLMNSVLEDIQYRDDNIYRVIFEAEPIPDNIRKAGFGGVDRYKNLEKMSNSELLIETTQKLDMLAKRIYIQSKSFDDVTKLVKNKSALLASIPAIQPIPNKHMKLISSGFGFRTHPIYKTEHMHTGIDFSANIGTPIYCTGDGVVERADNQAQGYGNHVVVNHGYGYQTLYGHMSKIIARAGQKVKRGDLLGLVGNTGLSTAPHLHYEVIKNQTKVNPINFFFNDLSPAEYSQMLELAEKSKQSFD